MAGYLTSHYKSIYRILPVIDQAKNDFCRDCDGNIDKNTVYIKCAYDMKIWHYGGSKLAAYIPSIGRGRNIIKELNKLGINIFDIDESDQEIVFKFNASDIEVVADLLKARTGGASISPWSKKNLPSNKIDIPEDDMARYKEITSGLGTEGMSVIRKANVSFMNDVLAKKLRPKGKRKPYDYASEMKQMGLQRDTRGYIYAKGLFEDYLCFLSDKIKEYNSNK